VTGTPAAADTGLAGLPAALADVVCWTMFTLHAGRGDEIDADMVDELTVVIAATLQRLAVADRLAFLDYAAQRAFGSSVPAYREFLLGLAETFGLE